MAVYIPNKQGVGGMQTASNEILADQLNIFKSIDIETDLISGRTIDIQSLTSVEDAGPYEFACSASGAEYIYLPHTRIRGTLRIKKIANNSNTETNAGGSDDYRY